MLRTDRRYAIWAALASLGFVAIGVSIVINGGVLGTVIGAVTLAFFGFGLVVLVVAIIRPRVLLTIDASGLRFGGLGRSARLSVPWDAVAGVRIYRFEVAPLSPGMRMLGVLPTDPASPLWNRGRLSRVNTRMAGVPASISDRCVSIELEQVAQIMRRFKPDLRIEYGEPRASGLGRMTRPRK